MRFPLPDALRPCVFFSTEEEPFHRDRFPGLPSFLSGNSKFPVSLKYDYCIGLTFMKM